MEFFDTLWPGLIRPLLRLMGTMSIGILVANTLEALAWERYLARLAAPLVRLGNMGEAVGSSFVTSFFSCQSAAALLSSAYAGGRISRKELLLANIFNSFPSYLVHLPNIAAIAIAILGKWGVIYLALGLAAALLRTLGTVALGYFILPKPAYSDYTTPVQKERSFSDIVRKIFGSFKIRFLRVCKFTVPIYIVFFFIQHFGGFLAVQRFMSEHVGFLSFLKPEALSIVAMSLATETGASMSAAAALLHAGTLSGRDIVIAMLVGNILSSPVRAVQHQFPTYAGYYPSGIAAVMVILSQSVRTVSLFFVLALYYIF